MNHNYKIGDKIIILRKPTKRDKEGWNSDWFSPRMDELVGREYYIVEPLSNSIHIMANGTRWDIPITIISLVDDYSI